MQSEIELSSLGTKDTAGMLTDSMERCPYTQIVFQNCEKALNQLKETNFWNS